MKTLKETLEKIYKDSKDLASFVSVSESLKRKIEKNLIYPGTPENLFEEIRNEIIQESVFDPIQNTRSEDLFDKNEKMKPAAKKQIMDILDEWRKHLNFKFEIVHMRLIGSMSGFQFNNTADVDINLVVKLEDPEEQIWVLRKTLPNGNNLEGTSHPINF
jgi:predicted nucleotidyltransferase